MLSKKEITSRLQSALSNKRYKHTLGVAEEAVKLSEKYGYDTEKAEIAALLHDCAKCVPDKLKLRLCAEYHIPVNEAMLAQPDLAHSFIGAEMAAREYGVRDEEILNAIRFHTTGRPAMGILEKVIYIADYIEPNREAFDSLEKIRTLAYEDLEEAIEFSLAESIKYVKKKKAKIHELTIDAYDYYRNQNT